MAPIAFASQRQLDELLLPPFASHEQPEPRRSSLRQHLGKLPQLEQRNRRVVGKVILRLRTERDETRVVVREVGEVR
ncbi:MAG TPA: hypothetical protein VGK73_16820 [Polyangiaceae bacterium]